LFTTARQGFSVDGIRIGALTAVLGMGLIIAMFALVDNIFLETVSQQVDKIRGFERSQYVSMRSYINWNLLAGAIFVLPVLGVIGAACGGIGGLLAAGTYAGKTNSGTATLSKNDG
jgi:hypothetical protein